METKRKVIWNWIWITDLKTIVFSLRNKSGQQYWNAIFRIWKYKLQPVNIRSWSSRWSGPRQQRSRRTRRKHLQFDARYSVASAGPQTANKISKIYERQTKHSGDKAESANADIRPKRFAWRYRGAAEHRKCGVRGWDQHAQAKLLKSDWHFHSQGIWPWP